jgi:hypothetical protein
LQKVIIIIAAAFLISGCAGLRKQAGKVMPGKPVSGPELLESTLKNNISEGSFFIVKASVEVNTGAISTRFLASIKYKKPDSLLLIVRSAIGTEAVRLFMTDDTIMINDRINKDFIVGKPGMRTLKYGISPDILFVVLGDLVIGNRVGNGNLPCINGKATAGYEVNGKMIGYVIDCGFRKVTEAKVEEDIFTGNIDIKFSKFSKISGMILPAIIFISERDSDTEIKIELEKATREWDGKLEFHRGAGYSIKYLK